VGGSFTNAQIAEHRRLPQLQRVDSAGARRASGMRVAYLIACMTERISMSGLRGRIRRRFFASRIFAGRAFACGVIVRLVLVGEDLGQRVDGAFELGQVVIDSCLQDRVSGVEVAVGQVIAHAGDLAQGMAGWVSSSSSGRALTASPISSSRIRTASKTSPSDRPPRCRWERIASIAAWMSASRCRSR
jgi:hypothetical protein